MAENRNPIRVHLFQMRKGRVTIRGDIPQERQWLAPGPASLRLPRIPARRANRQRHKAALRQLITKIEQRLAQPDARLRFIKWNNHCRLSSLAFGDQQVTRGHLPRGRFHSHPMLHEVFPIRAVQIFQFRLSQKLRPRSHDPVPRLQNFLPPRRQFRRTFHPPPVLEDQRRFIRPKVILELRGRRAKRFQPSGQRLCFHRNGDQPGGDRQAPKNSNSNAHSPQFGVPAAPSVKFIGQLGAEEQPCLLEAAVCGLVSG